ncbi:MAG: DUF4097 family beta strand repeat-containing protein [Steroidobacteraceae bacterium]
MRIIGVLALVAVAAGAAAARADCAFKAQREGSADLAGVAKVVVNAGLGGLSIVAKADAQRIVATGNACASTQALLDGLQVEVRREGDVVHIDAGARKGSTVMIGNAYANLAVGIALPPNLPLEVRDSSGDTEIHGVESLVLDDSSGDIRIRDVGSAEIKDSSGDISVIGARGDITVTFDGSGDINIDKVDGNVEVGSDGSGDIRIREVKGNVVIGSDGSGDILVNDVGGDFTLGNDGSGEVRTSNIAGKVSLP